MSEMLARAFLVPARTVSLPGAPGSPLNFSAGLCRIYDQRLVTLALRRADVTLELEPRYGSHAARWIAACGESEPAKARVVAGGVTLLPPHYTNPDEDALLLYDGASA